jgi:hypothetical protein
MRPVCRTILLACLGLAVADVPDLVNAQTTVTIIADRDNTLYEDGTGSLSNGAGWYLFAGQTIDNGSLPAICGATGCLRRALLHFDVVSAVPSGATITQVTLTMNMNRTISGSQTVSMHRMNSDWGEGASNSGGQEGAGATAVSGDATWLHSFYDTQFWTSAGGDFVASPSASQAVSGNGTYSWGSTAGLVSDVQAWLDSPSTNFGWVVLGNEDTPGSAKRFDSRESPTASDRPALAIQYTEGLPVELAEFDAIVKGSSISLAWRTLSETSNAGWDIETEELGEFRKIGFVEGSGTAVEPETYSFVVIQASPGIHRFRLRQLDLGGSFAYSEVIEASVDLPESYYVSAAYPNPFNPVTTLEVAVERRQQVRVDAVDMLGRVVAVLLDGKVDSGDARLVRFEASGLASGLYTIRVRGESFAVIRRVALLK